MGLWGVTRNKQQRFINITFDQIKYFTLKGENQMVLGFFY
jgi:hypothetical protein